MIVGSTNINVANAVSDRIDMVKLEVALKSLSGVDQGLLARAVTMLKTLIINCMTLTQSLYDIITVIV